MSTLELQNQLIRRILDISDDELLEYMFRIVSNDQTTLYKLSNFEKQILRESLEDYTSGKLIPNDEVFTKTEKWLSE